MKWVKNVCGFRHEKGTRNMARLREYGKKHDRRMARREHYLLTMEDVASFYDDVFYDRLEQER